MPKSSTHRQDGSKSPALWRGAAIEWPMPRMDRAESAGFANGRAATIPAPMSARSNYAPTRCAAAYPRLGPGRLKRDPGAREPRPGRDDGRELLGQAEITVHLRRAVRREIVLGLTLQLAILPKGSPSSRRRIATRRCGVGGSCYRRDRYTCRLDHWSGRPSRGSQFTDIC